MSLPIKFSSLKVAIVSAAAVLGIAAIGVLNWPTPQASVSHEEEEAGGPDKAFEWRRLAWLDENGQLATGALDRALAQRQKLLQTGTGTNKAGIDSGSWTFRGPSNVGGRTRSIVIDPRNTDRIFAGGVGGGIWRSTDGGQSWSPVNDQMESLAIACLTMDPQNPDVIYAGTGEGFFNSDAISGRGIWKTTDGGQTWNRLMSTGTWDNVCRIAVHPTDSNVVLACRRYGGIFRSTDAGASWTQVKSAQGSFFVAFNPQDGSKAVAHILDASGGWFHYAAYSSNAGATWNVSTGSLSNVSGFNSRLELAYAPSSPNIVYALAGNSGRVHKSTDGGQTFAQVTTSVSGNNTETGQLWYDNTIWVDPTNPNVLVLGAVHLYRSMDGGVTIGGSSTTTTSPSGRISNGYILTSQPHPDMHNIVSDPGYNGTTNRRVYIVNDGGVFRTDNILANRTSGYSNFAWTQLNNGYATSQFYGAAGHAGVDRIIGGLQDNGTLRVQGNNTQANLTFGGDGGWSAIDPTDPNYTYGEYVYLQIHRSTNGGASASSIYNGISDTGGSANFIAPFILDPNDPNVMLGGGRSLWRSTNVKATTPSWSAIRPAGSDNISAIAVAPGNSNIIWVAQNNGVVSKTTDGTTASPAWEVVDNNAGTNPLPNRYITRILIDPDNSNKVYVSTGGFTSDNLYRTVDGGATWTDITGNLPDAPIRGIARHPNNPNWLYVGTEVGIFATEDGGATWSTTNDGPATVSVDEVNFMHGSTTLLAATHGRGLWTSATEVAVLPDLTSFSLNPNSVIGGDPTSGIVTLSAAAPNGGAQVNLTSQSSAILPPSSITVPQGQTQATFTIGTAVVGATFTRYVSASYNNVTRTAPLTLKPGLASVAVSPIQVVGGESALGTVTLGAAAPEGGVTIQLSSNSSAIQVPASVQVPQSATSATFAVGTQLVGATYTRTITASRGTVSKFANLALTPGLREFLVDGGTAATVRGGTPVTGSLFLYGPAPSGGSQVSIIEDTSVLTAPTSVLVPSGSTTTTFTIDTSRVGATYSRYIAARLGSRTLTRIITLTP